MAFHHPHCGTQHDFAFEARDCEDPNVFPCSWLIEIATEDGRGTIECGAPSRADERGYACAAGHSHVYNEVRVAEGWDYADGDGEAKRLLGLGIDVVSMRGDGFVWGTAA